MISRGTQCAPPLISLECRQLSLFVCGVQTRGSFFFRLRCWLQLQRMGRVCTCRNHLQGHGSRYLCFCKVLRDGTNVLGPPRSAGGTARNVGTWLASCSDLLRLVTERNPIAR